MLMTKKYFDPFQKFKSNVCIHVLNSIELETAVWIETIQPSICDDNDYLLGAFAPEACGRP